MRECAARGRMRVPPTEIIAPLSVPLRDIMADFSLRHGRTGMPFCYYARFLRIVILPIDARWIKITMSSAARSTAGQNYGRAKQRDRRVLRCSCAIVTPEVDPRDNP